jgi:hypothetical protein
MRQFALLRHFHQAKMQEIEAYIVLDFTLKAELDILNQGTKASKAMSGALAFLSMNPRQCK